MTPLPGASAAAVPPLSLRMVGIVRSPGGWNGGGLGVGLRQRPRPRPVPPAGIAWPTGRPGRAAAGTGASAPSVVGTELPSTASFALATCSALIGAAVSSRGARTRLYANTRMDIRRRLKKPRKAQKILKSGASYEDKEAEDDLSIYDFIEAEEFFDEPPTKVEGIKELAAYSILEGFGPYRYDPPEYRGCRIGSQLTKALTRPLPVDQREGTSLASDIRAALAEFGHGEDNPLEDADVICSLDGLRILIGWLDGSLAEDMRANGYHTHLRAQAASIDAFRISKMKEAPNAIVLGTCWTWAPNNQTTGTAARNLLTYTPSFVGLTTGGQFSRGAPSCSELDLAKHFRILKYKLHGLNIVVRVPVVATVPASEFETEEYEGQACDILTCQHRRAAAFWSFQMTSRYAMMKLSDVGLVARGVSRFGQLEQIQELTPEDIELDKPNSVEQAGLLLGSLAGLFRRIQEIAFCPGCMNRPLWLQYQDADLRVISVNEDFPEDYTDDDEEESEALALAEPLTA
mmetsp:Transcript_82764/g.208353  ORF Transcript_82764/g.208353 Transcript_82764/m.208353 type:complete len:517 (+) Transcript_82764:79-1629(+)